VSDRVWPLPKGTWRINRSYANHSNTPAAIDFGAPIGTPVLAADAGVVITSVDLSSSYGTHVKIRHPGGFVTVYAHMTRGSRRVKVGDRVEAGAQVGKLGYTGNVSPAGPGGAHLHFEVDTPGGGTMDPAAWLSGSTEIGAPTKAGPGLGGQPEKSEPLPKPPTFKAGTGRSKPGLGDDTFTLNGKRVTADLEGLVTTTTLDMAVEQVAQVSLTVVDPRGQLVRKDLRGASLGWDGAAWDISAVDVAAAAYTINLAARSVLARRMRRTYRVVGEHKVGPDEWITRWVKSLGGKAVVEKTSKRGVLPASKDQSLWDALSGLCGDVGWSFTEYAGTLYAGSRMWAFDGGTGMPTWPATWKTDERSDVLDVAAALTDDDPDNRGTASFVLRWENGRKMRPWHRIQLQGLGIYDGLWLVESVQTPNDGTSTVTVSAARPRKQAQACSNPQSTSAPKDTKSPAYAKWYAKRKLAAYGWGESQWAPLEKLWTRESGWRWDADNPTSDAYGIPQGLPGSKMASAGKDWRTNPETQIRWGLGYIKGRYGSPARAWEHFQARNWY